MSKPKPQTVLKEFSQHHPWCPDVADAPRAECFECEHLFADYPFLEGETSAQATARYFPQSEIAQVEPSRERELVMVKPGDPEKCKQEEPPKTVRANDDMVKGLTGKQIRSDEVLSFMRDEELRMRAQRRADEVKRRADARKPPRRKKPYNPNQLGQPNRERNAKTEAGFYEENLAPHGAPPVVRSREQSPLSPMDTGRRQTFLDKALNDPEVQALFRFIVGTMVGENRMRLSASDDRQPIFVKSDGTGRLPFSEAEKLEIGARQYVWSKLPQESQRDIEILTEQVMPCDKRFLLSPIEFGKLVTRSSDERVAKGGYIGTFKKLAHHVNHLYVEWEINRFRQRRAEGTAVNSEDARLIENFSEKTKKVLA